MKMVVFLPASPLCRQGRTTAEAAHRVTPAIFVHFLLSPLRKLEVNVLRRRVPFVAEG